MNLICDKCGEEMARAMDGVYNCACEAKEAPKEIKKESAKTDSRKSE